VESEALRLGQAILGSGGLRERQAGLALMGFAGGVGARSDAGYSLPSLVALRGEWEAVRARVFAPASWMRQAGADLDRIQEPPPPPLDPHADAVIARAEEDLSRLLLNGQRKAELLGEPVYDPDVPGRGDGGQIRAWYRFGERYRRQLAEAMAPVDRLDPGPDPARQPLRYEAVRSLREAHQMLRQVPDGAGMWPTPFRGAWEARFEAARLSLARAREHMARAPGASDAATDHARWD
jgi:hypothetical protein